MNDSRSFRSKIERLLVRYRIPCSILIFGALIFENISEDVVPRDIFSLEDPLGTAALLLIVAGMFVRSWAAGTIHKTKQLASAGAYALMRHPLYFGSLLIGIGFSLIFWNNINLWVLLAVAVVFYLPKIRQEEAHLGREFGNDWQAYTKRTGMFFPRIKPGLKSQWSFSQWMYNHEYNALVGALAGLLALPLINLLK